MPTRRTFLKQSAGLLAAGVILPNTLISRAQAQTNKRNIFVDIQLSGGNDGANMVVPYTDTRYQSLRPNLHFKESELKDANGNSTILTGTQGLHPAMSEVKGLFDAGKVAIIQGVGYPSPNLSHFVSTDIWHTANPIGGQGLGWLGKYADLKLVGQTGLPAASVGGLPVKSLFANDVVIPNISNFEAYQFVTDSRYQSDRLNQLNTFNFTYGRSFDTGSFSELLTNTGMSAVSGAAQLQTAIAGYSSSVTYPTNNPLATSLKMIAQLITTMPEANLLYVQMGGFDHHASQIALENGQPNKLAGDHATLLTRLSQGVKAFYDDMAEHGLAENVLMMAWTEFGRRPQENASLGTDHGTVTPILLIGDPVNGGLLGNSPSFNDLDQAGNFKFSTDFRGIYAEILDKWLGADSQTILGSRFDHIGFLP